MNPLYPIEWAVAWLMVKFHALLSLFMDKDAGITWVLSIVGLTVVVRTLIIPLFVRQIRASRAMQMVSPELKAVQNKYKGKTDPDSKQKMAAETMAVYKEAGASPFSSCLPMLLQMPIFFGLFRVLYNKLPAAAAEGSDGFGPLTQQLAQSARSATFFGDVTIADSFLNSGDGGLTTKIVAGLIIACMSGVTFFTQKSLTMKNMPKAALEGPMANTQKMMLYMLPFIYVITGPGMPIGVLCYWLTTNVWTFVQQYIVIRATPTPGTEAEKARQERINAKRAKKGLEPLDFTPPKRISVEPEVEAPIRVQPAKGKSGKRLSDEEKLERARALRAKAAEDRRKAQEAAGEIPTPPSQGSKALNKGAKKKRKK